MSETEQYSPQEAQFEASQINEAMRQEGVDTYEKAAKKVDNNQRRLANAENAKRGLVDRFLGRNKITKLDILRKQIENPPQRTHSHEIDADGTIQNIPTKKADAA